MVSFGPVWPHLAQMAHIDPVWHCLARVDLFGYTDLRESRFRLGLETKSTEALGRPGNNSKLSGILGFS